MVATRGSKRSFVSRRLEQDKPTHSVWYESNKRGGFIIYAGVRGTGIRTYAGSATSPSTLDYNMRKAKTKFRLPLD